MSASSSTPRRILVIGSYAPSLVNFRGHFLQALRRRGVEVVCTAPESCKQTCQTLRDWGVGYRALRLNRNQIGILADLRYWWAIFRLCRRLRPDAVFAYTIKPNVFGLSAARAAGVRQRYALVTGLGYAFTGDGRGLMRHVVTWLYRGGLRGANTVFFQNSDDSEEFARRRVVRRPQICVVAGSGVDLDHFDTVPLPVGPPSFLLIARLLGDKGIHEYVDAARTVKGENPAVRFLLVGPEDPNPAAISRQQLAAWQHEGVVEYLGEMQDVRSAIAMAQVYVLPSYREGTPRTNLEAMAMGRPVITTDVPGCRDTVIDGVNGFLVPPRNATKLAEAMRKFLREPTLIEDMGRESRRIAQQKYDVHIVNRTLLKRMALADDDPATRA